MAALIPISIKEGFPPKWGYLVKDSCHVRLFVTEIMEKAVAILRTPRAQAKLSVLAHLWAVRHNKAIREAEMVRIFQGVLDQLEENPTKWLLTVMDWTMDDEDDATFFHDPWDINRKQDMYPVEDDVLQMNGIRLYYLIRDTLDNKPAAHIRKFELIITVVHEFAHLFISYLSYSVLGTRLPRLNSPRDRHNSENTSWQESGYTFERLLFSGTYNRGWDGSGREHRFLPGLPLLETPDGNIGISLASILRITSTNTAQSSYRDQDVMLELVPLRNSMNPVTRYASFYVDFIKFSGREYNIRARRPEVSQAPPEILLQATEIDIDARRWEQIHPGWDLATPSGSLVSGSRVCLRAGDVDTASSRRRENSGAAQTNMPRLLAIETAPRTRLREWTTEMAPHDGPDPRPCLVRSGGRGQIRKRRSKTHFRSQNK